MTKQHPCTTLRALVLGWVGTSAVLAQSSPNVGSLGTSTPALSSGPPAVVVPPENGDKPKFYTITVALREVYDDNIYTAKTGRKSSFNTSISPSVILTFPLQNTSIDISYSTGFTYFGNRPQQTFDTTHDFLFELKHSFSSRFNLSVSDSFRYYTEPGLFDNTANSYFRNGAYIANGFNLSGSAQWTPLFSSTTSYQNSYDRYETKSVAIESDLLEHQIGQSFGFALWPKVTLTVGASADITDYLYNSSYNGQARGYHSYTGNTGFSWQALPNVTISASAGGSVTKGYEQPDSTTTPYFALNASWQIGQRSVLTLAYSHSVTPTDVAVSEGQVSDHVESRIRYDLTPDITTHFALAYNHADYTPALITPGTVASFSEEDYQLDMGFAYHLAHHCDLEGGYDFSMVSSGLNYRNYYRDQVYLGVRGTY